MNSVSLVPRSRKQILRKLNITKNALVLEIGSGDKPEPRSDVLLDKYIGYTPDRGGREIAVDKRPFIAADAHQLPFKDKSFDYLIVSQVLEYSTNPDKFLKELMRVGKGGYIEVTNEIREILYDWDARISLGNYFRFYNTERPHQSHSYRTPAEVYCTTTVESANGDMVESLTPDPLRIAGPDLNIASILS